MIFNAFILALSASLDSLGVGITYGIKKTKISFLSFLILFILSLSITSISIIFGNILSSFISTTFTTVLGSFMLCSIGFFIIYSTINSKKKVLRPNKLVKSKEYNIFIRFLGITINIIKNPITSDLDKSNKIDFKEAIFLGLALSLDSVSIGFAGSTIGINSFIFPLLISLFQILFLSVGKVLGKKICQISKLPNNIWNLVSGTILISIGISKFF